MDQGIKASIDARYTAFDYAYELNDEYKKKVDELFKKINEFGKTCNDSMDFETKFVQSPLNQEYNNLFIEIGTNCKPKKHEIADDTCEQSKGSKMLDEAASDSKYLADDITMPARRKARQEFDSKMRDTPLGKVEQASNMFHLFKRFKKQKPEEISEEDN